MPVDQSVIMEMAQRYLEAQENFAPIEPISALYPDLDLADAYQIQEEIVGEKLRRGDRVVGVKVAATSRAIHKQFGLDGPLYGYMLESHRIPSGGSRPHGHFLNPHFETEMCFLLGQDLAGPGVTLEDALEAVRGVMGAFEINDSRTNDWDAVGKLEIVADACLTGGFVASDEMVPVAGLDLAEVSVEVRRNGEFVAAAKGKEILGHPGNALAWVANKLGEEGRGLKAGQLVLSGSMTHTSHIEPGDMIEAVYDGLGGVSATFV